MDRNQDRSFIAELTCNHSKMSFFEKQLNSRFFEVSNLPKNIITTDDVKDPFGNGMLPVGYGENTVAPKIIVHFRCYDDYYNLQILSEPYYQKYFSKNSDGILGAFAAAGGNTTSFNLLDANHNIITLDDLSSNTATVYLKARNSGIIKKNIWRAPVHKYYFNDSTGDIAVFELDIFERSARSPQHSTPYS